MSHKIKFNAKSGNQIVTELTHDEIDSMQAEAARHAAQERTRPLTESEVSRLIIRQQINTLDVDDQTAVRMVEFYPEWKDIIGKTVDKSGYKFKHNGKLYKTIPSTHTFQADWVPGTGTESLYTRIDEEHTGDQYDPIPYDGNMALTAGLYYTQNGMTYLCTRDTINPVYNALVDLVGVYVKVVS